MVVSAYAGSANAEALLSGVDHARVVARRDATNHPSQGRFRHRFFPLHHRIAIQRELFPSSNPRPLDPHLLPPDADPPALPSVSGGRPFLLPLVRFTAQLLDFVFEQLLRDDPSDLHAERVHTLLNLSDQLQRVEHQLHRFLQRSVSPRPAGTSLLVGSLHGGSPFSLTTGSYDPVKGTAISLFN
jgi:hypothetical protein